MWARPINRSLCDQYGIETYWKILFAQDLWVTPNLQLIFNPTYNTTKTVLAVGGIKLHLFFSEERRVSLASSLIARSWCQRRGRISRRR